MLTSFALVGGLAGVTLLSTAAPAEAATITVTAPQAQMSGHVGTNSTGTTTSAQNGDRYRFGSASTATTSGSINNTGGSVGTGNNTATTGGWFPSVVGQSPYHSDGYTNWVSNGTTAWSAHGYDNAPSASDTRLNLSEQSALGFEPSNVTQIETGTYFNLGRMVHSNNPVYATSQWFKGDLNIRFMGQDMSYQWLMNETPNDATPNSDPANNDLTTFLNQVSDKTFTGLLRGFRTAF
ncbi:hypothetical protein SAMN06298212_1701 [Ruaniaceae bacterium KH17]|nr:hypothetical protein SAMN06298212_1701 [Ruaniaceae bacterium KH17]